MSSIAVFQTTSLKLYFAQFWMFVDDGCSWSPVTPATTAAAHHITASASEQCEVNDASKRTNVKCARTNWRPQPAKHNCLPFRMLFFFTPCTTSATIQRRLLQNGWMHRSCHPHSYSAITSYAKQFLSESARDLSKPNYKHIWAQHGFGFIQYINGKAIWLLQDKAHYTMYT